MQEFSLKLRLAEEQVIHVLGSNLNHSLLPPWPEPLPEILPSLVSVCLPGPRRCFVYLLYTLFLSFFVFFYEPIQLYLTAADSNSGHSWQLKPSESSRSFW